MKRANIKRAAEIESEIEKLQTELNSWELCKTFNGSSTIQIRTDPYMNSKYFSVDLSVIPFSDLRKSFLKSINDKITQLELELQKLLHED